MNLKLEAKYYIKMWYFKADCKVFVEQKCRNVRITLVGIVGGVRFPPQSPLLVREKGVHPSSFEGS